MEFYYTVYGLVTSLWLKLDSIELYQTYCLTYFKVLFMFFSLNFKIESYSVFIYQNKYLLSTGLKCTSVYTSGPSKHYPKGRSKRDFLNHLCRHWDLFKDEWRMWVPYLSQLLLKR